MKADQPRTPAVDTEQAEAIATLWANLTDTADSDPKAGVFLLMFGPWARDQLANIPKS